MGARSLPSRVSIERMQGERPPRTDVSVEQPRCPYCHDDVRAGGEQRACTKCRAWHHRECWDEAGQTCSACGEGEVPTERTGVSTQEIEDVRPYRSLIYALALVSGGIGASLATKLAGTEGFWDFLVFSGAFLLVAWAVVIAGIVFVGSRNRERLLALERLEDATPEEQIEGARAEPKEDGKAS